MSEASLIIESVSTAADADDVRASVDRGRAAAGLAPRSGDYWRWLLELSPDGGCLGTARRDDGSVQAAIVGVRRRATLRGELAFFLEVTDVYNAFEEGQGLLRAKTFVALGQAFAREFGGHAPELHPVMYGVPTRRAHRIGLKHLGWEILRSENKLSARVQDIALPAAPGVTVDEVEAFPREVSTLFERFAQGREAVLVRDPERLDWRFRQHPGELYRIGLAQRSGEIVGYAVHRIGRWDGREDGLVCDWLVRDHDPSVSAALLEWSRTCARDGGAEHLTVSVPDKSPEWGVFQDLGLRALGTHDYLVFRSFQRPYIMSWLFEHWYYTLADSDRS